MLFLLLDKNPDKYDFNDHACLFHYLGIKPENQEKWNLWEYEPGTGIFEKKHVYRNDDVEEVFKYFQAYFKHKDIDFMKKLYDLGRKRIGVSPNS